MIHDFADPFDHAYVQSQEEKRKELDAAMRALRETDKPRKPAVSSAPPGIHQSIVTVLERTQGEDIADALWRSWFKDAAVRGKPGNYAMRVDSKFKKHYIETHYQAVLDQLKIVLMC